MWQREGDHYYYKLPKGFLSLRPVEDALAIMYFRNHGAPRLDTAEWYRKWPRAYQWHCHPVIRALIHWHGITSEGLPHELSPLVDILLEDVRKGFKRPTTVPVYDGVAKPGQMRRT